MTRWIVVHVPAAVLLAALIVLVAGGAVLVQMVVRRRFPALKRDAHNDVARFTYGVIAFVYAFFMGFVVNTMWGQTNTADGNARAEGAAAVQLARALPVFSPADQQRLRQALGDYERAAIAEWTSADTAGSPAAETALRRVYAAYEQVQAVGDTEQTFLASSYADLEAVSKARTVRLLQARSDTGPPWPLWAVIALTSTLVLGTAVIYGVEDPALHYAMVAVVGVLVAANLFLVIQLSHPFIGEVATSPAPLQEALSAL